MILILQNTLTEIYYTDLKCPFSLNWCNYKNFHFLNLDFIQCVEVVNKIRHSCVEIFFRPLSFEQFLVENINNATKKLSLELVFISLVSLSLSLSLSHYSNKRKAIVNDEKQKKDYKYNSQNMMSN